MMTLHFDQALLPDGWARDVRLTVADGVIASIETGAAPAGERHAIALPGMPNLHSHAFQRGMAGLAEAPGEGADSFWTWREVMYRFVDRVTPDDLIAIAAQAYVEMLEGGFTRVGEFHYLHHAPDGQAFDDPAEMSAAIVAAAGDSGIGLTLLPVFYAHGGFGPAPLGGAQRRFASDLDGFAVLREAAHRHAAALPDAVVGVAPHSLRAATLGEIAALAAFNGPVHIHIAEQMKEVDDCIAATGARPVELLLSNIAVDARWCLVHATHMTRAESEALARSGAVAGLCPITEANLGDGLFDAGPFLAARGAFGVGSDSNVLIDASEELRLLDYGQRLAGRTRNRIDDLWSRAVAGGARAVGVPAGLIPGAAADFITLDPDHPSLAARDGAALADALVFAAGRGAIDGVWRRGRQLVSGGRHHLRERIAARYRTTLKKLLT